MDSLLQARLKNHIEKVDSFRATYYKNKDVYQIDVRRRFRAYGGTYHYESTGEYAIVTLNDDKTALVISESNMHPDNANQLQNILNSFVLDVEYKHKRLLLSDFLASCKPHKLTPKAVVFDNTFVLNLKDLKDFVSISPNETVNIRYNSDYLEMSAPTFRTFWNPCKYAQFKLYGGGNLEPDSAEVTWLESADKPDSKTLNYLSKFTEKPKYNHTAYAHIFCDDEYTYASDGYIIVQYEKSLNQYANKGVIKTKRLIMDGWDMEENNYASKLASFLDYIYANTTPVAKFYLDTKPKQFRVAKLISKDNHFVLNMLIQSDGFYLANEDISYSTFKVKFPYAGTPFHSVPFDIDTKLTINMNYLDAINEFHKKERLAFTLLSNEQGDNYLKIQCGLYTDLLTVSEKDKE